jgi:predicted 2-oxoglutarate/Fe(II)-dependent dioxygenase YbiX
MAIDAVKIDGVLTPDDCARWIEAAERAEFTKSGDREIFSGNRLRTVLTDQDAADAVWQQIKPHVTKRRTHRGKDGNHSYGGVGAIPDGEYEPFGVSPMFRFSKYVSGGSFGWHVDTCYAKGPHEVGMDTLLLYLNDDYVGGETVLKLLPETVVMTPKTGSALAFYHFQTHAGMEVQRGMKYLVRTEVLYRKVA